jgi:predicted dehydrogenase
LPCFKSQPDKFEIVALLNSNAYSAKRAVEKYQLGRNVACYGDIQDLVKYPNVEMVVVSVKVPMHAGFIRPTMEAQKHIFVEWPLASNLKQAEELTQLAGKAGVKNVVGLQARQDPSILRAKQMMQKGELGEILGTTMYGSGEILGITEAPVYEYMADINNGANQLTIPAGHALDALCYVLGEMSELLARLAIRRRTVDIVDLDGKVLRTIQRTSHDWLSVTGTLQE